MAIRIGLIGAGGRLGKAIESMAREQTIIKLPRGSSLLSEDFDLYLDASLPEAFEANLEAAKQTKRPIVIGVTGLSEKQIQLIEQASQQIPIFYAPNFSIGMAVMRTIAEQTARLFPSEAVIIETHHIHKKDAPSGAAKLLASAVNSCKPSVHSLRIGQTIGKHELQFNCPEEQLTIVHTSHSRTVFAKGALAAAQFLSTQSPGLYTMDDLMKESTCNASR